MTTANVTPDSESTDGAALSLNEQRYEAVLNAALQSKAKSIIDLGCGEGKLLVMLTRERQFQRILGVDVSIQAIERAASRLRLDRLSESQRDRIDVIHGSLMYRDKRFAGFDCGCAVEVIEHLDPPRLAAFERVVFEFARPETVIVTTPNREYNAMWESLPAGSFRHSDHRFEWSRLEFAQWCERIGGKFSYGLQIFPIGPESPDFGSPTQMVVFRRS